MIPKLWLWDKSDRVKIGQLKDDNVYLLNSMSDNILGEFNKTFWITIKWLWKYCKGFVIDKWITIIKIENLKQSIGEKNEQLL